MTGKHAASGAPLDPSQLRFHTRGVTPEEIAAVTAVMTAAAAEQETADTKTRAEQGPDAWARTQRSLRGELRPGAGAWRSFSG